MLAVVLARCSNVHSLFCAVLKAQEESGDGDEHDGDGDGERTQASELVALQAASSDVLDHVCDTAHQRCGRLLAVSACCRHVSARVEDDVWQRLNLHTRAHCEQTV